MDGVEVEGVTYNRVDPPVYLRDPEPAGPLTEDGDVPPLYRKWPDRLEPLRAAVREVAVETPYGLDPEFVAAVDRVFAEARDLLLRKHANYGGKNISQSPGGPLNGLRVRKHDKSARLNNMIDNGVADQVGETLEETLIDDGNYSFIGVLVLRGEWPDA